MSERLNLVILVLDTARRDRFGCYGHPGGITPAIDAFARESVLFEHMITPGPWTVPSHATLFTGLYPREHGADNPGSRFQVPVTTLAAHLQAHGYATGCITNNMMLSRANGLADGFQYLMLRPILRTHSKLRRQVEYLLGTRDSGAMATNGVVSRYITGAKRPFFVLVNYLECHWQYVAPWRFERRFVPPSFGWIQSMRRRLADRRNYIFEKMARTQARGDEEGLRMIQAFYEAELATVDDRVGRLINWLRRAGRLEDTIVIVTSDHGEMLGEGGLVSHQGTLHGALVHIPFIARIPGRPAARISGLTQTTDVFAGLCSLLGVEVPPHLAGRPFAVDPFALNAADPGRAFAFAEWAHWGPERMAQMQRRSPSFPFSQAPKGLEAAQDRQFKLVVRCDTGEEALYDLAGDPGETANALGAQPAAAARLRDALFEWQQAFPMFSPSRVYSAEEEARVERHLRELGYM